VSALMVIDVSRMRDRSARPTSEAARRARLSNEEEGCREKHQRYAGREAKRANDQSSDQG